MKEIMKSRKAFTGHPMDHGWIPHEPETWPYQYATLKKPMVMQHWRGHDADPEYDEIPLSAGERVKIVMVSRLGDVGITENLKCERGCGGYGARVPLDDLDDFSNSATND